MDLKGQGASLGKAQGVAEFYKNGATIQGRIVLVDGSLTPEIAVELTTALGVAVSQPGVTSHGANILREFRIPCLVGVEGICEIEEGCNLILDCYAGTLRVAT